MNQPLVAKRWFSRVSTLPEGRTENAGHDFKCVAGNRRLNGVRESQYDNDVQDRLFYESSFLGGSNLGATGSS